MLNGEWTDLKCHKNWFPMKPFIHLIIKIFKELSEWLSQHHGSFKYLNTIVQIALNPEFILIFFAFFLFFWFFRYSFDDTKFIGNECHASDFTIQTIIFQRNCDPFHNCSYSFNIHKNILALEIGISYCSYWVHWVNQRKKVI